ncbi:MAG: hypothetical protein E7172_04300 [Firmicutes bacterium]|nr:hypothetical protein [Bacillota bacterium]
MKKNYQLIGSIIGIILILITIIYIFIASSRKKLVCNSANGSITIIYNSKGLKDYNSKNINFDFEKQQKVVQDIGIENYIKEYSIWFKINEDGNCK